MGSDTVCYIKSDLKNKFSYFKFEKDTVFQRNKADKNNNLVFILHGEMEVIYGDLYPRLISGGNMILLTPLSRCVCKAVSTVELIILGFGTLNHSCDKYIFQNLTPFFSLIKYEFRELEIRPQAVGDLEAVKASYESLYGTIAVDWTHRDGMFTLNVTIPVNCSAKVYLPGDREAKEVKSGTYSFKKKI